VPRDPRPARSQNTTTISRRWLSRIPSSPCETISWASCGARKRLGARHDTIRDDRALFPALAWDLRRSLCSSQRKFAHGTVAKPTPPVATRSRNRQSSLGPEKSPVGIDEARDTVRHRWSSAPTEATGGHRNRRLVPLDVDGIRSLPALSGSPAGRSKASGLHRWRP
jgi:hypothetical protein